MIGGYESFLGNGATPLDLIGPPPQHRPGAGTWFETKVSGFDLGTPEAEVVIRKSLLLDGDRAEIARFGNRPIVFEVFICGRTPREVGTGEKLLAQELGRRNRWTWKVPGPGSSSVFEVVTSTLKHLGTQLEALDGVIRVPYQVTLTCGPWAYGPDLISEPFPVVGGTRIRTVDLDGSVRVPAALKLTAVAGGGALGDVMIASDPTYASHGWSPDDPATWGSAPEGDYYAWVKPSSAYAVGDVFSTSWSRVLPYTPMGNGQRTRTKWTNADGRYFPIGPFFMGGRRDRLIGGSTLYFDLKKNGVSASADIRLFREAPDTSLLYVRGLGSVGFLWVDPENLDSRAGIYAGPAATAASVLDKADSWAFPIITPPTTSLYVWSSVVNPPLLDVIHRPAFHSTAAAAVS